MNYTSAFSLIVLFICKTVLLSSTTLSNILSKLNVTYIDELCLNTYAIQQCFDSSLTVVKSLKITSLSDLHNLTTIQKHDISSLYYNIGQIYYFGQLDKNPNLSEALAYFIISSFLGNEKAQFKIYILIHNELNEQIVSSKSFKAKVKSFELLKQISQTTFYKNFNYSITTPKEQKNAIALSFLMSSALAHYPPAMNTVGYKYLNGYGLPYSCEIATKYYMQSSYETVNRIAKTKEPIYYSYNSLVDYEYVEKKFSNAIQPNSEDELEFYKLNAKEGKINYIKGLAQKYLYGQGIKQNFKEAKSLFELGVQLNDTFCMFYLGEMYLNGWGVDVNYQQAFDLFTKASYNYTQAWNSLGYMYYYGYGVEKNVKRAYDYFKKAAFNYNEADGYFNLLTLLLEGKDGITADYPTAYKYAGIAADGGKTFAQYIFAMMNHYKIGSFIKICDVNVKFFKVISEKNTYDKYKYDLGIQSYYNQKYRSSALYYLELAEEGSETGQINFAILLSKYDIFADKNYQNYMTFKYMKLASKSNIYAKLKMGDFYFNGFGKVKQDYNKALKYYERVKAKSSLMYPFYLAHSMFNLGFMYSFGLGVNKNLTKAYMYYNATRNMKSSAKYPAYLMIKFDEYLNNSTFTEIVKKITFDSINSVIYPRWKIMMYLIFVASYVGFYISLKNQSDK